MAAKKGKLVRYVTADIKSVRKAKRKKTAGVAAGVAAGAGAAAGILLAPKSGKETREDIKMKTGEIDEGWKTRPTVSAVKEKIEASQEKKLKLFRLKL